MVPIISTPFVLALFGVFPVTFILDLNDSESFDYHLAHLYNIATNLF